MILHSVTQTCAFIRHWLGLTRIYPRTVAGLPDHMPDAVKTLNRHFGQLWQDKTQPPPSTPPLPVGLFGCQNTLLDPAGYRADETETIKIISGQKGTWHFGYRPSTGAKLYASDDWNTTSEECSPKGWSTVQATVEDALIFALLSNLCSLCREDEESAAQSTPLTGLTDHLWSHPAWSADVVFKTDPMRTHLTFEPDGPTLKRKPTR